MGQRAFEIEFVPDFFPIVAPKMVRAGSEVLEPIVRKKLVQAINITDYSIEAIRARSKRVDRLFESIRISNTFIRDSGTRFFANVFFEGRDARGLSQGEKAAYLNYGTGGDGIRLRTTANGRRVSTGSTKKTLFARGATNAARAKVHAAMQAVLDRELRGEFQNE